MTKANHKKKILVLGGTGFIGQKLVITLQEQGRNVAVFKGDILDKKTIKPAVEKADIVVNLVGSSDQGIYSLNVLGNLNLLECCKEANIKKIVFVSSGAVYGRKFLETDRPNPTTEYGLSKYLAEEAYRFYAQKYGLNSIILRPSNVYGPGQKKGVVIAFLKAVLENQPVTIYGDGKQRRDFLYIDDAAEAIIRAVDYETKGFDIFNISGPKTYFLLDVISLIERTLKKKARKNFLRPKEQDIKYMSLGFGKAQRFLGYKPRTTLPKGIKQMVKYAMLSL